LTARIFVKLILAVVMVLAVALTAVDFLASRVAERTYVETLRRELFEKGRMIARLSNTPSQVKSSAELSGARVTWIAKDGIVLADSEADPEKMENHSHRPELAAALQGRDGWSIRPSPTMGVSFLYVAIPVQAGALRLAVPLSKIKEQVNAIRKQVLLSTTLAFIPSVFLAGLFARHVSARLANIIAYAGRLARGDFRTRLDGAGSDELGILSRQLNETGEKLQHMFEELEREHAALDRLERVRRDFVVNVSHELRTPLASIQGYTETLLEGALHDPQNNVRFLQIIRQNAERLGRLTADLLTLSRIELKTQKFQFAHYFVNPLIEQHADSMRPIADKKRISLVIEPAPANTEVFCDSEAMHQIATNLLDNAIKYTPEGGTVTIGARPLSEMEVQVYVRDTGIGIPNDELPRLFERFYRVDKARSRDLGGTGLGLAIVKHLVHSQGGEITVASVLNQGSTFTFSVPIEDTGLPEVQPVQTEFIGQ
jgi:two-component system phosphate regulon sensor histidine kinase PhoR